MGQGAIDKAGNDDNGGVKGEGGIAECMAVLPRQVK